MTKIAFVIPWYGEDISGGAESECRRTAENLHKRGYDVEVLTTCVKEFESDWSANYYNEGNYRINGVTVRRFRVRPRDAELFHSINYKLLNHLSISQQEEEHFVKESVNSDNLYRYIGQHIEDRIFIFIPYLYGTTYWGSRICPERSYVIPCLHDEPYAHLGIYKRMFREVKGVIFHSLPEQELAQRLCHLDEGSSLLVGEGVDTEVRGDAEAFRRKYGIKEDFVLYAGRKGKSKNTPLLIEYIREYQARRVSDLKLVLIGSGFAQIPYPAKETIIDLGFVPRRDMFDAMTAATLVCQPSLNESFSLAIMESWVCGTAVLVHADCAVTTYHCRRSNGGLYFRDYAEFEECLDLLLSNPGLRRKMAALGGEYVRSNYNWDLVVERFVRAIDS